MSEGSFVPGMASWARRMCGVAGRRVNRCCHAVPVAALALCVILDVADRPSLATLLMRSAPAGLSAVCVPRPPHRTVIWVGGDSLSTSLGEMLGPGLNRAGAGIAKFYKPATGLARVDRFDWASAVSAEMRRADPTVAVFMLGGNDCQNVVTHGNRGYLFGTDAWRAEYSRRVGEIMDRLAEGGRQVIWVGLPVMRDAEFAERTRRLNEVYRAEAASRSTVLYIETWPLLADTDGNYVESLPDARGILHRLRSTDGIHFYPAGACLIASAVAPAALRLLHQQHPEMPHSPTVKERRGRT